jgi:hypothetical protein
VVVASEYSVLYCKYVSSRTDTTKKFTTKVYGREF